MRKAIGNAVRKEFASRVEHDFRDFAERRGCTVYLGDRLYQWTTPEATFFLRWLPHKSKDAFTVEYSWSSTGEPARIHGWGADRDNNPLSRDGHYFRISQMATPPRHEYWWLLADDMLEAMLRTQSMFMQKGDQPIDTLVRSSSEAGFAQTLANYQETPIGEVLTKVPAMVEDCMVCISLRVLPYFGLIRELRKNK